MELKDLREQIDTIDAELVELFIKRMRIANQVAEYKKTNGLPVYVQSREEQILQNLVQTAGNEFEADIRALYATIFALSRKLQEKQVSTDN